MTKSRHPDPRPDSDHPAQVFDRSSEILDEQLPGILQEIDEAAALLSEILGTPVARPTLFDPLAAGPAREAVHAS